jgi:crossover junction endodeoxyribonuclease RusA
VLKIMLPYPPSINSYYRTFRGRMLISKKGREYRVRVAEELIGVSPVTGRVAVEIDVFPPDRRRRDLDNVQKALLDAIEHAGIIEDDSMIDDLHTIRGDVLAGGMVTVTITPLV